MIHLMLKYIPYKISLNKVIIISNQANIEWCHWSQIDKQASFLYVDIQKRHSVLVGSTHRYKGQLCVDRRICCCSQFMIFLFELLGPAKQPMACPSSSNRKIMNWEQQQILLTTTNCLVLPVGYSGHVKIKIRQIEANQRTLYFCFAFVFVFVVTFLDWIWIWEKMGFRMIFTQFSESFTIFEKIFSIAVFTWGLTKNLFCFRKK